MGLLDHLKLGPLLLRGGWRNEACSHGDGVSVLELGSKCEKESHGLRQDNSSCSWKWGVYSLPLPQTCH